MKTDSMNDAEMKLALQMTKDGRLVQARDLFFTTLASYLKPSSGL
ncbi:hypothetical protein [Desulfopila sp. IMCC35008]|nr:hypothetical protein [Desulfopila sp. IMCC35008]